MKLAIFFINLCSVIIYFILSETEGSWIEDEEEQEALAELKTSTDKILSEEFMKEDAYLLRWLKAYDFDIEKTLENLQVALDWRKENNVSRVLYEEFTPRMENDYPVLLDGTTDKFDRPIMHISLGSLNLRRVTIAGQQGQLTRFIIQKLEIIEKMIYYTRKIERPSSEVTNAILINDVQGFNLISVGCWNCLAILPVMVPIMDTYYPGIFYKIYFVNAPGIFNTMLSVMKKFMTEASQASIELYGNNKLLWSEALLKQIAPDQLPEKFGGYVPARTKNSLKTKLIGYMEAEMEEKAKKSVENQEAKLHIHDDPGNLDVEGIILSNEDPKTSSHGNHEPHHHFTEAEAEEILPEQHQSQGHSGHDSDEHKRFMKLKHEHSSHNFTEADLEGNEVTYKSSSDTDSGLENISKSVNPQHSNSNDQTVLRNSGSRGFTKQLSSALMSLAAIAARFFYLGN